MMIKSYLSAVNDLHLWLYLLNFEMKYCWNSLILKQHSSFDFFFDIFIKFLYYFKLKKYRFCFCKYGFFSNRNKWSGLISLLILYEKNKESCFYVFASEIWNLEWHIVIFVNHFNPLYLKTFKLLSIYNLNVFWNILWSYLERFFSHLEIL